MPSHTKGRIRFALKCFFLAGIAFELTERPHLTRKSYGRVGLSKTSIKVTAVTAEVMAMAYQMNRLLAAFIGGPPWALVPPPRGPSGAAAVGARTRGKAAASGNSRP